MKTKKEKRNSKKPEMGKGGNSKAKKENEYILFLSTASSVKLLLFEHVTESN